MHIDLNADLGEGFGRWTLGDDAALLDVVTSANIACGFHAGDPSIMRQACQQAAARGVRIGAQVGYRDLVGFGRRHIDIARGDLTADILYQLGALQAFAVAAGGQVDYLKPHGALYNTAVIDPVQAGAIVDAVSTFDRTLPILTLPGSMLAHLAAEADIEVVAEAFADRSYRVDGTLVPRGEPGALLTDAHAIAERAVSIARDGRVPAEDDGLIGLTPQSLCIHGDTPGSVTIARAVRDALVAAGVELQPFC